MRGKGVLVRAITAVSNALGAATAWAHTKQQRRVVEIVQPVDPAYHPHIFGNPAARDHGFVQSRDGTWRVQIDCFVRPAH